MDDIQKQQNQAKQSVQNASQVQPVQSSVSKPVQQEEWVLPTSGGKVKESEPLPSVSSIPTEWVTPSEPAVELPKEVAEAGVEAVKEMPQLTEEDKKAGLEAVKEAAPIPAQPAVTSHTPLTEEQVKKEVTGNPVFKDPTSARYWLAMLLQKYFAKKKGEKME